MFAGAKPTGEKLKLADVAIQTPCDPSKMIGLWNNFHQLAAKNSFQHPDEPLYFLKAPNSFHPHGQPIVRPKTYAGRILYEGELGVVIGKRCFNISEAEANDVIFGYTCVNDVTAVDLMKKFPTFDQWTRVKSFDTFGVFGPTIATGVDPDKLVIRTVLNGKEVQNYPVADMFFPPHKLVAAVSKDMTLEPGDVIACGTSLGAGVMDKAENTVEIVIDGVGRLINPFNQTLPSPYLLKSPPAAKKTCVVGAGAIGGLMAAKFAIGGDDVTVIDMGPHLASIQKGGIKLEWHDGKVQTAKVKAVEKAADAGKHDIVVLAVKAHYLDQVVKDIDHLLGPDTIVLTVQNGLPWWYFQKLGGKYDNQKLDSLDPTGVLSKKIPADRIVGCVVYPAAAVTAPGVIHHVEGDRFPIGELDGSSTERVKSLHDTFVKAGLKSRVLPDIRSEIWLKAWGNLSFNPISALTHATLVDICQFAETRELRRRVRRASRSR
jgi:2-keto-4-pentenoate hydratase/2-oxohepta-3-ene-1,7-dioic acid hydratase in catechol pathway/ketopantoate reductase